jgi:membrane protein DedA with SNARE-associated domain
VESGSWQRVLELASQYGYAFLFLVSVAENTFLLGLVVPGDVAVVLGGALSASGQLRPITLTLVVVLGVVLGANLSFWIGRRGGIPLIERSAERFSIDHARMKRVEDYFESHGAKTVFLASFVSGIKNLIPAIAGASRMGTVRFFAYNAAGSVLRCALLVAVGYLFGASFPRAVQVFGSINVWILGILVAAMVVLFIARRRKSPDRP